MSRPGTSSERDFQIFSSLLYSPVLKSDPANTAVCGGPSPFYLLPYHRDRLLRAAEHFNWPPAIEKLADLDGFRASCDNAVETFLSSEEGKTYAQSHKKDEEDKIVDTPLKIRTLLSRDGKLEVQVTPTPPVHHPNLFPKSLGDPETLSEMFGFGFDGVNKVFGVKIDSQPLRPGPFTKFKTTSRMHYEAARRRADIATFAQPDEVLLWNDEKDTRTAVKAGATSAGAGEEEEEGPMGEVREARDSGEGNGRIMEGSITNVYFYREDRGGWITPSVDADFSDGATGKSEEGESAGGTGGTVRRWLLEKGLVKVGDLRKSEIVDGEWVWISNGVKGMILGKIVL